jgi:LPXTG-motif cell wall-anchored protein
MKLRRAMAAAAATAVVAPLTLLSAPTAFAAETARTTETTETTSATPTADASATTTPTATATAAPTDTATTAPAPTGTGTPTGTPTSSSPTADPTQSETSEPEPTEPSDGPTPPDAPYCEELDEDFADAKVTADVKGLPGRIVAGDGFHPFRMVVTNESDVDITGVSFYAEVENYELDESKFLSPYVDLQFKNPTTGSWSSIRDAYGYTGDYFLSLDELKARAGTTIDLRLSIDAKAPAGDAYSFASGTYLDNVDGQDCLAEGWAAYDFQVLKAGSSNPAPGTAAPSDGKGAGKGTGKGAQGGVRETAGSLAETGSSSALPVIGLVGGVAVVAGAGAVFVVRRRRAGTDA